MISSLSKGSLFFTVIYIFIILITFSKVYSHIYDDKIDLAGDNAAYYILGKSIATGQGYRSIQHIRKEQHSHFPPGYPLFISGIMSMYSTDAIDIIKRSNGILFFFCIVIVFFIARRLTDNVHLAFISSILYSLNHFFLQFSTIMMSEMLFQFIASLSLLLILHNNLDSRPWLNWKFLVTILLIGISIHVRTLGICLAGGLFLWLLLERNWIYLIVGFVALILTLLPWKIRNSNLPEGSKNNYISSLAMKNPYRIDEGYLTFSDWRVRITENTRRYITKEIPNGIFSFKAQDYQTPPSYLDWLIGLGIIGLIGGGIYQIRRLRLFIICYIICCLVILLNWPQVWEGPRFSFQLLPLLLIMIIYMITKIFEKYIKYAYQYSPYIFLTSIVWLSPNIKRLHHKATTQHSSKYQSYIALSKWTKENLEENTVIACRKPNLFHIYSDQYICYPARTPDAKELINKLKHDSVDYIVVDNLGFSSTTRYLIPAIKKFQGKFKKVCEIKKTNTVLLKFDDNLGYQGEMDENNLRSGYGTFKWENGMQFEGQWKNHKKNGKGTLYTKDNIISGFWTNDHMNGKYLISNLQNVPMYYGIFKNNKMISTLSL